MVALRAATNADSEAIGSLLSELGYPTDAAELRRGLRGSLERPSSRVLLAESEDRVIGCLSAELVPYFPNGSMICRVTAVVVSVAYRRRGIGAALLAAAAEFAREHHCWGVEVTTAERRLEDHHFYERLGFSQTSFRFFCAL